MAVKDTLQTVNAHNMAAFMPKEEPKKETLFGTGGSMGTERKEHKDELRTVNKHNLASFNKEENLYAFAGQMNSRADFHNNSFWGNEIDITSMANADKKARPWDYADDLDTTFQYVNGANVGKFKVPQQKPDVIVVNNNSVAGNPAANGSTSSNIEKAKNAVGQVVGFGSDDSKWDKLALAANAKDATWVDGSSSLGLTDQYKQTKNWMGLSKEANPFSKGNIGNTMKGIGGAAAAIGTQIGASDENPRGMFDVLDPVHALAGGRESAVGNAMSDAGVGIFQAGASTGQPYLMIAGAAMKVLGGLTNAAFGIKEDKVLRKAADESINANKNFMSSASSFDDINGPASRTATNVFEGGWFSGGAAKDKNEELARKMADAFSWADRSVQNNIGNIAADQIADALRNYSAFGGYLTRPKRRRKVKR